MRTISHNSRYFSLPALCLALALPGQAFPADEFVIEEIVVTAQKRTQNVMDVPISMSVFSSTQIEENHIMGLDDIASMTPNLSFLDTGDMKFSTPKIRGVDGNVLSGGGIDQPTAVYVDEVYINSSVAQQFDLYDLERIEILRGPQGTLFGRNTVAGVISVHTKKAPEEFEGFVEGSYGNYGSTRIRASLGGPIVEDRLFGKMSAVWFEREGYTTNTVTGEDANGKHNWGTRANLRFNASDDVTISITGDYRKVDQDGRALDISGYNVDPATAFFGLGPAFGGLDFTGPGLIYQGSPTNAILQAVLPGYTYNGSATVDTDPFDRTVTQDFAGKEELDAWGIAVTTDVDFENMSLKSITSYRTHEFFQSFDLDATDADNTRQGGPEEIDSFMQELRLTSTSDGRFEWMTGVFYYYQDSVTEFNVEIRDPAVSADNAQLIPAIDQILSGLLGILPPGFLSAAPFGITHTEGKVKLNSYAAFANSTFHVSDRLDLTVGARYTYEEKSVDYIQTSPLGNVIFGLEDIPRQQNSDNWSAFTPTFIANYHWSPDVLTYASVAKGFKSGGFSDIIGSIPDQSFEQEITWNYELGLKAQLFDGRLNFSAAAFQLDWQDQQGTLRLPPKDGGVVDILQEATIGDVETTGIELEFVAIPMENLQLFGGFASIDKSYKAVTAVAAAQAGIAAGDDIATVPDYTLNLGGRLSILMGSRGDAFVSVAWEYRDDLIIDGTDPAVTNVQDGYGLLNASFGFYSSNDHFSIVAWGKNLNDEDYISFQRETSIDNFVYQALRHNLGPPRTYGIDLRYSFF